MIWSEEGSEVVCLSGNSFRKGWEKSKVITGKKTKLSRILIQNNI